MVYTSMKKKFKNLSLKKKLFVFYSVLLILPLLLISSIIYTEVSKSMLEKIQFSATQSYEQATSYLEYKILQMIQRTDVVVTNDNLKKQILQGEVPEINEHEKKSQL